MKRVAENVTNFWAIFPQKITWAFKSGPNGEISSNLVTLQATENFIWQRKCLIKAHVH
jgi:hypothetical protein